MIIGALIGGATYTYLSLYNDNFEWGGLAKNILIGGAAGAVGGYVFQSLSYAGVWAYSISGAASSLVSSGLSTLLNGQDASYIWKNTLTGFVGGFGAYVGGGSFFNNLLWGAATGAATGALSSYLNGDDILEGALIGGIIGGALAITTSGIEMYKNKKDGYGFRTDTGVVKKLVKEAVNIHGVVDPAKAQRAIDYVRSKFGMEGVRMTYDNTLVGAYGITDPLTGDITIGNLAFKSADLLKATTVHELGHSLLDRVLDSSGSFIDWAYPQGAFNTTNSTLSDDGPLGYAQEIYNAGKMKIGISTLNSVDNPLWSQWNKGWLNKILYTVPARFNNKVILKYY